MEQFFWSLKTEEFIEHYRFTLIFLLPLIILHYQTTLVAFCKFCWLKLTGRDLYPALTLNNRLDIMIAIPTLLREVDELDGLKKAILSAIENGYPGRIVIVPAIDGYGSAPALFQELVRWSKEVKVPENVRIFPTGTENRSGKAVALHSAVELVQELAKLGKIKKLPAIFFCLDADSILGEDAIRRLVYRLTQKSRITRQRPVIVAANIKIAKEQFWEGWRGIFTVKGFLALSVAAEYMSSISIAKFNYGFFPVTVASGAFYGTWFRVVAESARYAGFLHEIRWRDCVRWWFGGRPPKFSNSTPTPLPHALAGEGDDTWMTIFALSAVWRRGRLSFDFPRTPLEAAFRLLSKWIFRPFAYDSRARVYTKTPTTIPVLFKQRMRWNTNGFTLMRFRKSYGFLTNVYYLVRVLQTQIVYFSIVLSTLLFPLYYTHPNLTPTLLILYFIGVLKRAVDMILVMVFEDDFKGQWHKLILTPVLPWYHFFFNTLPGILSNLEDILFFGSNRRFAPEATLIAGKTIRIALSFRIRRFTILLLRTLLGEEIPIGWFWFGWHATPWTSSGYEGWDSNQKPTWQTEFNKRPSESVERAVAL